MSRRIPPSTNPDDPRPQILVVCKPHTRNRVAKVQTFRLEAGTWTALYPQHCDTFEGTLRHTFPCKLCPSSKRFVYRDDTVQALLNRLHANGITEIDRYTFARATQLMATT